MQVPSAVKHMYKVNTQPAAAETVTATETVTSDAVMMNHVHPADVTSTAAASDASSLEHNQRQVCVLAVCNLYFTSLVMTVSCCVVGMAFSL